MNMKYKYLLLIPALMMTACSGDAKFSKPKGLSYIAEAPIRLNVDQIEVVKTYKSSKAAPHVEHNLAVPPMVLVQQWVQDRLMPVGKAGRAVVTVQDASIIEVPLERTKGFKSIYTIDQTHRYDAKVVVKVEIFDESGQKRGFTEARASGSQTVTENMTLSQKRQAWTALVENMMNSLDRELEGKMRDHLEPFIR